MRGRECVQVCVYVRVSECECVETTQWCPVLCGSRVIQSQRSEVTCPLLATVVTSSQ